MISITTSGETTCYRLNTRDLRIATQRMTMFTTSLVWTPSHMRASMPAPYFFYLHLERERSSRWGRNCQRNCTADEKLFITSHGWGRGGGGGVKLSKRPRFCGAVLKIQKM